MQLWTSCASATPVARSTRMNSTRRSVTSADAPDRRDAMKRWIWLGPVLSVAVVIGVLVLFGLSLWTSIAAALLLGCLIATLWAYFTCGPRVRADAGPRAHADDDPGPELRELVRQVRGVPALPGQNSWTSSDAGDPRLDVAAGLTESPEAREIDAEERG